MSTFKELMERRAQLSARIDIGSIVVNNIYDTPGIKEKYGHDNVDAVLMMIETQCLNPLREELAKIDTLEVGDGKRSTKKKSSKPEKSKKEVKGGERKGTKAAGKKSK